MREVIKQEQYNDVIVNVDKTLISIIQINKDKTTDSSIPNLIALDYNYLNNLIQILVTIRETYHWY